MLEARAVEGRGEPVPYLQAVFKGKWALEAASGAFHVIFSPVRVAKGLCVTCDKGKK